ncbi:MAG: leucyl aminopeptidase [Candidatus Tectomicrobia bacterium]|nr:leucyl aminopeptidase [Candidatus Tectomicrobia bacterium]
MRGRVIVGRLLETECELAVLPVYQGKTPLRGSARQADAALKGAIQRMIDGGEFRLEPRQRRLIPLLHSPKGVRPKRLLLVGMGEADGLTADVLRGVAAAAAQAALDLKLDSFHAEIPGAALPAAADIQAQAWMEGAVMGLYRMDAYRKKDEGGKSGDVRSLVLVAQDREEAAALQRGTRRGWVLGEATNFARDLVTQPANVAVPAYLAGAARSLARKYGMTCRVLEARDAEKLGMRAYLSVAQASASPPKFIVLDYPGRNKDAAPIALLGKGVTFDSGGLDIKSSGGMRTMKTDMSGAAAVLGAMRAIAELRLPQRVVALLPCTENMISGKANRPGDVVASMAGITIEIDNTDAEGRLILCDALAYARRYRPQAVLDAATLTGACVVALGESCSGLLGNSEELIGRLKEAAGRSGDRVWELPLWKEYFDLLKSDIADIKNTGGRWGGAITAAAFLARFAEDFPWAHLDIAGPAWRDGDLPYTPKGASGVGVRLFAELVAHWRPLKSKKKKWDSAGPR